MNVTPDMAKNARLTAVRLTAKPRFLNSETSKLRVVAARLGDDEARETTTPRTIGTSTEAAASPWRHRAWMMP